MLVESITRSTTRGGQVSTSTSPWTYVVDFLCLEPKVVIEVDGGQHAEQVSNDLRRTNYLKVLGYRVLQSWNHEVLGDPDAVLESIRAALVEVPSPPPSPGGRGS